MYRNNIKFFRGAIASVVGDNVKNVRLPVVHGTNNQIMVVEHLDNTKTVFRFNNRQTAHRNYDIGLVMKAHDIAAPRIALHLYQGQYFETYPYITGQTLAERLKDGIEPNQIQDVYAAMATKIKQIADIPLLNMRNVENYKCQQVAQANIVSKTGHKTLGAIVKSGTTLLNWGEKCVCHCDFTPQNIIIDDKLNIAAVLDLNAVSVANINFALAITGLSLDKYKLNKHQFYSICNELMPHKVHRSQIRLAENACKIYFNNYTKQK